jgi:hypothetical protein
VIYRPTEATAERLSTFERMVREGGEVGTTGLSKRIRNAKIIVMLELEEALVGVSALKRPDTSYRDGIFKKAGVPQLAIQFFWELGWIYVPPKHRGKRYSYVLAAAALSQRENKPTFATTRLDNVAMHRTLEDLRFRRLGDSWQSTKSEKQRLMLYALI